MTYLNFFSSYYFLFQSLIPILDTTLHLWVLSSYGPLHCVISQNSLIFDKFEADCSGVFGKVLFTLECLMFFLWLDCGYRCLGGR